MKIQFRTMLFLVLTIMLASIVLSACGGPRSGVGIPGTSSGADDEFTSEEQGLEVQPAAGDTIKNPDTLIQTGIGEPESLDPAWAYDTASGEVIFNVYETLLFPKKDAVDEFVPLLADSWEISGDGMTYTFYLRDGIHFHKGQALTAEDVAYSFWRGIIQDRAGGPQWILLQPIFGLNVQSFADDVVEAQFDGDWTAAVDDLKERVTFDDDAGIVTFHLAQPYGPMLQILSGSWASVVSMPWVVEQGGWDGMSATAAQFHDPAAEDDELFNVMNGTGPFMLERWATGEEISLVRNDDYWLAAPLWDGGPSGTAALDRVVIKKIDEWGTRFATFQTGDADIAYVDRQYISQIDPMVQETCDASGDCVTANADGTLRMFKGLPTVSSTAIFFNQMVNTTGGNDNVGSGTLDGNGIPADFFSDINIRQAFNYCFDWDTYIEQVWNGEAEQLLGPIISGLPGYDADQAHYSFDLDKCADAFKAATIESDDGQSVWDIGFHIQYRYNEGNDQRRIAGEILKDSLAKVNPKFQIEIVGEPWPTFLKNQSDGRLPLFMLGWQEDFHDPHNWVQPFLSSGGTYANSQSFDEALQTEMDQLINEAAAASDVATRIDLYQQLQNLAYENALDIFVVQAQGRHYEQEWVHGWYYNPTYPGTYFYALSKGM